MIGEDAGHSAGCTCKGCMYPKTLALHTQPCTCPSCCPDKWLANRMATAPPFQSAFTVNPAPYAAAPAVPPPGSVGVGTITFHGPNGDVTAEYNPLGPHISDLKETPASAKQVGGNHYKDYVIQPAEFITRNKLGFLEGCIVKRVCRYMKKGDNWKEDLLKARHELDLLIEFIEKEKS